MFARSPSARRAIIVAALSWLSVYDDRNCVFFRC
jgi:hypothetical protein